MFLQTMTIQDLTHRFLEAQAAVQNINCGLLAGSEKVRIEKIHDDLMNLWVDIEKLSEEHRKLKIVNYEFPK